MEVLNDLIEAGIGQKHLNELVEEKEFLCLKKQKTPAIWHWLHCLPCKDKIAAD